MKKFTSVLLAVAMVATMLVGCGAKDTAETPATESTTATESTAAEGTVFKIGGSGPLTGGAAVYGIAVQNGAQIAVDEINAAGGINGFQIEFNFADDEHDAEKAGNAYNTLKDWGMQMFMGTVTSGPCVQVVDKTFADNMYQLTPSGTAVTRPFENIPGIYSNF